MKVFRLCKEIYSHNLLASGIANRWNKRGEMVIYAGSSRSLATLESIVHRSSVSIENSYKFLIIEIQKFNSEEIKLADLPEKWSEFQNLHVTQKIGSDWFLSKKSLFLKVPSAVINQEFNVVINTEHQDFQEFVNIVSTEEYFWDLRLL